MIAQSTKHLVLYFSICFMHVSWAARLDYQSLGKIVEQCGHLAWTNSLITFLQDPAGNKYLVKQIKSDSGMSWSKIICEVVALEIGDSIDFPQNSACIIPAGVAYIGKETLVPATLHTHVPGVRFDKYAGDLFPGLSLKQRDTQGKRIGLTRDLIYHMSRHPDFPVMVAYDTFVNNPARHKHNFFYDESSDRFYGIDMGASFHGDVCQVSLRTIERLLEDQQASFSKAEKKGLRVYCDTLKQLAALHNPTTICEKLDTYARYAGLLDSNYFDIQTQDRCAQYLAGCKRTIHKSYRNALALIEALEQLFKQKRFKKGK